MTNTSDKLLVLGGILVLLIINSLFSTGMAVSKKEHLTQADKDRSAIKEADGKANSLLKRTKNMIEQLQ